MIGNFLKLIDLFLILECIFGADIKDDIEQVNLKRLASDPLRYYPEDIRRHLPASSETNTSSRFSLSGLRQTDIDRLLQLRKDHTVCLGCHTTIINLIRHECRSDIIICNAGSVSEAAWTVHIKPCFFSNTQSSAVSNVSLKQTVGQSWNLNNKTPVRLTVWFTFQVQKIDSLHLQATGALHWSRDYFSDKSWDLYELLAGHVNKLSSFFYDTFYASEVKDISSEQSIVHPMSTYTPKLTCTTYSHYLIITATPPGLQLPFFGDALSRNTFHFDHLSGVQQPCLCEVLIKEKQRVTCGLIYTKMADTKCHRIESWYMKSSNGRQLLACVFLLLCFRL